MSFPGLALGLLLVAGCVPTLGSIVAGPAYDRGYFSGWTDADNDCQDTRAVLLAMTSQTPVTWSAIGCTVHTGLWFDPYTGQAFSSASDIEVDRLGPMKWAWDRGASQWPRWKAERFALDPDYLVPASRGQNRDKGAQGPLEWMPAIGGVHCAYVTEFLAVVGSYDLALSPAETRGMVQLHERACEFA